MADTSHTDPVPSAADSPDVPKGRKFFVPLGMLQTHQEEIETYFLQQLTI
jgi:hypothetical protein